MIPASSMPTARPSTKSGRPSNADTYPDPVPLFIYGTLMFGGPRQRILKLGPSQHIPAITEEAKYDLVLVSGAFPGMVKGNLNVVGELVYIPRYRLDHIDFIEGTHLGTYTRELIEVDAGFFHESAYAYLLNEGLMRSLTVPLLKYNLSLIREDNHVRYYQPPGHDLSMY